MQNRLEELRTLIKKADKAYYEDNYEIMSNKEYDDLRDELVKLEEQLGIDGNESLSNKVSGKASNLFEKHNHKYPMLSLDKTKDIDSLKSFLKDEDAVLSYKMDGLTLVLYYKDYKLDKAVTRGDGLVGEDVTKNIALFTNIPLELNKNKNIGPNSVIRGEAVMSYNKFDELNNLNDGSYKNPRNLASGLLRNKELKVEKSLEFIAYDIQSEYESDIKRNYVDQLKVLKENQFTAVTFNYIENSLLLEEMVKQMSPDRIEYPVDGLVLKMNKYSKQEELGYTSKFPKFALAFKWKDDVAESKMLDIEWSVARSGLITPVAIFEPVELEGTTVQRASVHNLSTLKSLKLGKGDIVTIYKANQIIPQILSNKTKSNSFVEPKKCPSCGADTCIEKGSTKGILNLVCKNKTCIAQNIYKLELFVGKEGFDIKGLSEKTLGLLVNNGLIKKYEDIFYLKNHREELVKLPLLGETSVNNLLNEIELSREIQADKFLRAFGVDLVGVSATRKMFKGRNNKETLELVLNADKKTLMKSYFLGDVASDNLIKYLDKDKEMMINILKIVKIKEIKDDVSNKLNQINVCITGKLETISRKDLSLLIEKNGGKVQSSVSSTTNYLVNNDVNSTSSKNKKAKKLNIPIITEEEILQMIK